MLSQLNQQFSSPQVQFVEGEQGFIKAVISNTLATCEIYLHGANVTSFVPQGQEDVFWVSKDVMFKAGKSIRGGIPVCWPWFGPHYSDASKGPHGFARLVQWQVVSIDNTVDGATELVFGLSDNEATRALWPFKFDLQYKVRVAQQLTVTLTTNNRNDFDIQISEALHSYFAIGDINQTSLNGLDGVSYFDAMADRQIVTQADDITVDQEVDRVYFDTQDSCLLNDDNNQRTIRIGKSGSDSTIVWNPWIDKALSMPDVNDDGYQQFICVETGNALKNVVTIEAGQQHSISQIIGLE
ncbi:MAG: glucose-6-phosphate 1-epimerase [Phenylobacterium sp.]|jgi:glucose-6-phosphate 1-epimerase